MSSYRTTFMQLVSCCCCKHQRASAALVCIGIVTVYYLLHQYFDNEIPTYVVSKEVAAEPTARSRQQQEITNPFKIRYKLVYNSEDEHHAIISITNTGSAPIKGQTWTLYFCSIRLLHGHDAKVTLHHINGCLHKIEPASESTIIRAGETFHLYHKGNYFIGGRTHVMPNWYLVGPNNEVRLVRSTVGEDLSFVEDFKTKETWKRYRSDEYDPYSPEKRYDVIGFDAPEGVGDSPLLVIPQPLYVDKFDRAKRLNLGMGWRIHAENELKNEAKLLQARFKIPVEFSTSPMQHKVISLKIDNPGIKMKGIDSSNHEAYLLNVNTADQTVRVVGNSPRSVFYGIQTLLSLVDKDDSVPEVFIQDSPRYSYRGMHLDVGRNFMPKSAVLRLLDAMATYKMNKFHFHLTDDEGWRLEIPGLPELTQVGARRCHDLTETICIQPELGALPNGSPNYYSVDEYKEILQYASDRHIQVIPEFDMPGHGHAAIKSMEVRYKNLKKAGDPSAEKFLLVDLKDSSKYQSVQLFNDNTINPCLESTYNFISHVIESVMRMHSEIQPLTVYHFGGDEVPRGVWEGSEACDKFMSKNQSEDRKAVIKEYFIGRLANLTAQYGLKLGGWADAFFKSPQQEIAFQRDSFGNKDVIANVWNNARTATGGNGTYVLANAGYKVIMTQATHLYFDHPYEPDPEERGNHWATRFIDTQKVFGFMPDDVYANTGKDECKKLKDGCLRLKKKDNIIGMSAALWTEIVRTPDQMDFMIFPRLLSLAERAWHKASWEDIRDMKERNEKMETEWEKFSHFIVKHELPRLDKLGIKYRLPLPGARFEGRRIKVRTALPGLPVKYSKNGGKTWHDVTDQTDIDGKVYLTTWSTDDRRMSRMIEVQSPSSD
ncbi:uncharacterized protein LOC116300346 [Actinia tenebrosa]|uniref:beta-N-acetylhexosaminidase n=1 Tax=Actinia tenebrosa TaxID=6105 RepID=A0A6P8IF05_ACTTE|nr:uncharacterized protein LOC116300346 [Actinia tenebrosa]